MPVDRAVLLAFAAHGCITTMGANRYNEKMEECEELKEMLAELRGQMEVMRLQMQETLRSKQHAEAETQKLRKQQIQAMAKSAGPVDRKHLSGPSEGVTVIRKGYLMKLSGGKKDASGKKKRSMGSMRPKWERRWFVLVEGADLDGDFYQFLALYVYIGLRAIVLTKRGLPWVALVAGDGVPDMGLYYYESEEAQKAGGEPSGRVELAGVKISTEVEPKTNETIMILDSFYREIKCVAVFLPSYLVSLLSCPRVRNAAAPSLARCIRVRESPVRCAEVLVLCEQLIGCILNRIKDDPHDDEDIDINDWIPDLEDMIARQQADPSLISPFAASVEDEDSVEPGSPSALAAAVPTAVVDPQRVSISSAGGEYDHAEVPRPPPRSPTAAAAGSAQPVPAPTVGSAGTVQEVRCNAAAACPFC